MSKVPISRALIWVLLSTIIVSGPTFLALLYYQNIVEKQKQDPCYSITELEVHCPQRDPLSPLYLQELLQLSYDSPVNLYRVTTAEMEKRLLSSPVIRETSVEKKSPHTLVLSYRLRNPIAHLLDYENTAIDSEGVIFPLEPFYSNKRLPELYLGLAPYGEIEGGRWGKPLLDQRRELGLHLLRTVMHHICSSETRLKRIDVSQAFTESLGKRQIVVILEEKGKRRETYLRLSPKDYKQELANYCALQPSLSEGTHVLEMRLPFLAYDNSIQK